MLILLTKAEFFNRKHTVIFRIGARDHLKYAILQKYCGLQGPCHFGVYALVLLKSIVLDVF